MRLRSRIFIAARDFEMKSNYRYLANISGRPEIHRRLLDLLGDYRGSYALGVVRSPYDKGKFALLLWIEGRKPKSFPRTIPYNGHQIPVAVKGSFRAPALQSQSK